jgi:RES domain-containing protein
LHFLALSCGLGELDRPVQLEEVLSHGSAHTYSAKHPGRWDDDGQPVVYAAPTIAMAILETAAHIHDAGLPLNRFLLALDVPDAIWALREVVDVATLAATWSAIPAGHESVKAGSCWLSSLSSPILLVPSAVVPEDSIGLIDPRHAASAQITARVVRAFEYNRLLRQ